MQTKWTDEELLASVKVYLDMLNKQNNNISFVKKEYYKNLSNTFNRTEKSFEYRMQNISYVLLLMGRTWIKGLPPAKNVGSTNIRKIEQFINNLDHKSNDENAYFESLVKETINKDSMDTPSGISKPNIISSAVTTYQKDPYVKAWVLKNSNWICECCKKHSPFITSDGHPYLEVHHMKRLSDGGSDTVTNVVALCPNCHREIHYGINSSLLVDQIYKYVKRLIKE